MMTAPQPETPVADHSKFKGEFTLSDEEARKLQPHPYCLWFPELDVTSYEELENSIIFDGLLEPIILLDGHILDGRHRLKVCLEVDVLPRFRNYDAAASVIDWVLAKNLYRRHLTDTQALAIALTANGERLRVEAAGRKTEGGKQGGRGKKKNLPQVSAEGFPDTRDQLAELAGTSRYKAEQALRLFEQSPALLEQVTKGETTLHDAVEQLPAPPAKTRPPRKRAKPAWRATKQIERCQKYLSRVIQSAPSGARLAFIEQLREWLAQQETN
jgi:ParB-like chromosome segregation protein Spo0J